MMSEGDLELRVRLETDPSVMAELGGPRPEEDIARAHARALISAAAGECWPFKVIPDDSTFPAGWVTIFASSFDAEPIYEMGWMVLPEFQGRGIASEAVGAILERARKERKFGDVHAFPGVTNAPSNRVCAKNGFADVGECEVEFAGHTLRCNHWRVDVF